MECPLSFSNKNYRIGRSAIDASDWAISARLENCVRSNPKAKRDAYREFFLQHIWERSQFYDSLARRVLKQPVRHALVVHHNPLNALFLDDLISMFLQKRWQPIDAKLAFSDPVYDLNPDILPAGELNLGPGKRGEGLKMSSGTREKMMFTRIARWTLSNCRRSMNNH